MTAKLADKIVRQRADDIVDVDRAAGQLEAQRRAQRHADKGGAVGGGKPAKGGKKFGAGGTKKGQTFAESKGGPRAAKQKHKGGVHKGGVQKGGVQKKQRGRPGK